MRTAEELFNEIIKNNEKRVQSIREDIINELEYISRQISEEVEHLKKSDDYMIDSIVMNSQSRLLDVLRNSKEIPLLRAKNSAYEFAMEELIAKEE